MHSSAADVPVPVTVRPLRMLGGGANGSKEGGGGGGTVKSSKRHPTKRASSHHWRDESAATSAEAMAPNEPLNSNLSSSSVPTPAPAKPQRGTSQLYAGGTGAPTLPRPTVTIFTELEENDSDGLNRSGDGFLIASAAAPYEREMRDHHEPKRCHSALAQTQTCLLPCGYNSLCQQTEAAEGGPTPWLELVDAVDAPHHDHHLNTRQTTGVTACQEEGLPDGSSFRWDANESVSTMWEMSAAAAGERHEAGSLPARISATPVVPLAPYLSEPSCRRRVVEDMQRFYETGGRGEALMGSPTASASVVEVAETAVASSPPPEVKRKTSKRSLFGSSSSAAGPSKKTSTKTDAADAKRKNATAAERRLAKEQVIRVGVRRLTERLNELHLVVHRVRNDGNCQFRAISHQLFGNEDYHDIVRSQVVSYMRSARAESFDCYFESPAQADVYYDNLAKLGSWGDELSLRAASDCLYVNIHVLSSEERNYYITYRPSTDRAASAPSFLVDVWMLRERRRAERRLLLCCGPSCTRWGSSTGQAYTDARGCTPSSSLNGGLPAGSGIGVAATMPNHFGPPPVLQCPAGCEGQGRTLLVPQGNTRMLPGRGRANSTCFSDGDHTHQLHPNGDLGVEEQYGGGEGAAEGEEEEEVDANAIQLALHRRLQHSEIRCNRPVTMMQPSSLCAMACGGAGGGYSPHVASLPLLQPQSSMKPPASSCQLLRPAPVPVPRLGMEGDNAPPHGVVDPVERFRALGAEVQPVDAATQVVNIFTRRSEPGGEESSGGAGMLRRASAMEIPTAPASAAATTRKTLLHPQVPPLLTPSNDGMRETLRLQALQHHDPSLSTVNAFPSSPFAATRHGDNGGELMLLACKAHGGCSNMPLQHSFSCLPPVSSPGGNADSFSTYTAQSSHATSFAERGGGYNGGGWGVGTTRATEAHSLGQFIPHASPLSSGTARAGAESGGAGGSSSISTTVGPDVCCFSFEPRTEPIDIFLSYLYPVHYNSLSIEVPPPTPPL